MVAFVPIAAPEVQTAHLRFPDRAEVRVVRVIGDFNSWNAPGQKLSPSLTGEGWTMDLSLNPGVYRYVFLPNGATVPLGKEFERQVNVVVIPPAEFARLPEKKGDGIISAAGVAHTVDRKYVSRLNVRTYALRIRTRKNDVADEVVAVHPDGSEQKNYPMRLIGTDPLFDYYEAKVVVPPDVPFSYLFFLDDGDGVRAVDRDGLQKGVLSEKPFRILPRDFKVPPNVGA
jgi:hypothetical protein